ncbi:MAG: type II secretion system protein GspG, partial [Desulfobacteraceae bacterium]|nr:type II secretion system protein GspG [Desulfobacteraceae bacterium]
LPRAWRERGYLEKGKVPRDPWDNEYVYLSPGVHGEYDFVSYGADGVAGGEGKDKDINSWELD